MGLAVAIKKRLPWWARMGAKMVLARLQIPYGVWKRLGLFEHGDMNRPRRALETVLEHARTAQLVEDDSPLPHLRTQGENFTVLEIGPGDSIFTALIVRAMGAARCWLIDAGPFATTDMQAYGRLANELEKMGFPRPVGTAGVTLTEVLKACNARYFTDGVRSMQQLPTASVDFCFSNAVLEHIPKDDLPTLAQELRRVLKQGGTAVHRVDLQDHLGGALNNLRFSESTWEGRWFRTSGFYTNRIRFTAMIKIFEQAGFSCKIPRVLRWDSLPTARAQLAQPFADLPDSDLLVLGFDLVLKPLPGY